MIVGKLTIWRNGPPDRRLVVELESGRFVGVRGLRTLLEISRAVQDEGGNLVLVSSSRTVARVLAILDLDGELSLSRSAVSVDVVTRRTPDVGPEREKAEAGTWRRVDPERHALLRAPIERGVGHLTTRDGLGQVEAFDRLRAPSFDGFSGRT